MDLPRVATQDGVPRGSAAADGGAKPLWQLRDYRAGHLVRNEAPPLIRMVILPVRAAESLRATSEESAKCGRFSFPGARNSPQFAKTRRMRPERSAPQRWRNGARG